MWLQVTGPISSQGQFFVTPTRPPFGQVHSHHQGSLPLTSASCFMLSKTFHLQRKEREGGKKGRVRGPESSYLGEWGHNHLFLPEPSRPFCVIESPQQEHF